MTFKKKRAFHYGGASWLLLCAMADGAMAQGTSAASTQLPEITVTAPSPIVRRRAVVPSRMPVRVARTAPGSRVFCRILSDCVGAEWPLSRKFGCDPEMAVEVLDLAKRLGLEPCGISFHVGSQQRKVKAWDRALAMASTVFRDCAERGISRPRLLRKIARYGLHEPPRPGADPATE